MYSLVSDIPILCINFIQYYLTVIYYICWWFVMLGNHILVHALWLLYLLLYLHMALQRAKSGHCANVLYASYLACIQVPSNLSICWGSLLLTLLPFAFFLTRLLTLNANLLFQMFILPLGSNLSFLTNDMIIRSLVMTSYQPQWYNNLLWY